MASPIRPKTPAARNRIVAAFAVVALLVTAPVSPVGAQSSDAVVQSIVFDSEPEDGEAYGHGEYIFMNVNLDRRPTFSGTPELMLNIGGAQRAASYRGKDVSTFGFYYQVTGGDVDADGISFDANSFSLDGTDANPAHDAVAADPRHKVSAPLAVSSVSLTSDAGDNDTYSPPDVVEVTVTYNGPITLTAPESESESEDSAGSADGYPSLELRIGDDTRIADYSRLSGDNGLVFAYTVAEGDLDDDGISIEANKLTLPEDGAAVTDSAGRAAPLTHDAVDDDPDHKVGPRPRVIEPQFQRTDDQGTALSLTTVRSDFWVRVHFKRTTDNRVIAPTSGFDRDAVTVTNGTIEDFANHPRHAHIKFWEIRPDADATSVTITVPADTVVDSSGNTNAVGSITYTVEPPLKPTLSTTAQQPVLGASFRVDVSTNHDVVFTGTHLTRFSPRDDVTISHGQVALNSAGSNSDRSFYFDVDGYGSRVGWITVSIAEDSFTTRTSAREWNQASNELRVWVGAPFTISGESSVVYWHSSTAAIDDYGVSDSDATITWSLSGDDSDDFAISSSGQLTFAAARDYDIPTDADADNVYLVTVNAASDDHAYLADYGASYTATKDVTVTVDKEPRVSSVQITSDPGDDDTYAIGDDIEVTVRFDEPVTAAASDSSPPTYPQLSLDVGGTTKTAVYDRQGGSDGLVFAYTVAAGDSDTDGVSLDADSVSLNGGTILDSTGNAATLTHTAAAADTDHKVDGIAPGVSTVAIDSDPGDDDTYEKGDTITVAVAFDDDIAVTGTPQMLLDIGGHERSAAYSSTDGATVKFSYTVLRGNEDDDGISIDADSLQINGGTITDSVGNAASLDHDAVAAASGHKVSAPPLGISTLTLSSDPGDDDTYEKGDTVAVAVAFDDSVTVTGTPQLMLNIGGTQRAADYSSASGSTVNFTYTVATGDIDADGISIDADSLQLNGGTIEDSDGVAVSLDHDAVAAASGHKVSAPRLSVTDIEIRGTAGDDDTYEKGDRIRVAVRYTGSVTVTGTPQLMLNIGGTQKAADYNDHDQTVLLFDYTVETGDIDDDGISIDADSLQLNGGTISDTDGDAVLLTHAAVAADAERKVSAPRLAITTVALQGGAGDDDTYGKGDTISVAVVYASPVSVTGTPQLMLNIGGTQRAAVYVDHDQTTMIFGYTVVTGDIDGDGVSIDADSLRLNGGTISDADGAAVSLSHEAVATDTSRKVSAPVARITSIEFNEYSAFVTVIGGVQTQTPATVRTTDNYTLNEIIEVFVVFSEAVSVQYDSENSDPTPPHLNLNIGGEQRAADYIDQRPGHPTTLVFRYIVSLGDSDTDGISFDADSLVANDGTVVDVTGVAANVAHSAIADSADHKVFASGGL